MFLKEPDQLVGSLNLQLFELEVSFCLQESGLQFLVFPGELVDSGVSFRHLLFPGHRGQRYIYVLDGNVA